MEDTHRRGDGQDIDLAGIVTRRAVVGTGRRCERGSPRSPLPRSSVVCELAPKIVPDTSVRIPAAQPPPGSRSTVPIPLPPIAQLAPEAGPLSGFETVLELHAGLLALDHDSRIVCREGSVLHDELRRRALPHYAMPLLGRHDLLAAHRLGRWAQREGAVLHAHSAAGLDLARWASRLAGARRIVFSADDDDASVRALDDARIELHLVTSPSAQRRLEALGVAASRIEIVSRGIDLDAFEALEPDWGWRATQRLAPGELLVGCGARTVKTRGQLAPLIRAFAEWRSTTGSGRLVVMDGAVEFAAWLELARESGLGDVVARREPHDELLPCLAALDIFVGYGHRDPHDTLPLAAMACGRPVIAQRESAAEGWIESDRNGALVEAGDVGELAAALGALQRSAARRQAWGHAARERAQGFDLRATIGRTAWAYGQCVGASEDHGRNTRTS